MATDKDIKELVELADIASLGGLWFDTAIAKLRFVNNCCQQRAGCCARVSRQVPLPIEEFAKAIREVSP